MINNNFSFEYKGYQVKVYIASCIEPYCYAEAHIRKEEKAGRINFYKKFSKNKIIKICKKWIDKGE